MRNQELESKIAEEGKKLDDYIQCTSEIVAEHDDMLASLTRAFRNKLADIDNNTEQVVDFKSQQEFQLKEKELEISAAAQKEKLEFERQLKSKELEISAAVEANAQIEKLEFEQKLKLKELEISAAEAAVQKEKLEFEQELKLKELEISATAQKEKLEFEQQVKLKELDSQAKPFPLF